METLFDRMDYEYLSRLVNEEYPNVFSMRSIALAIICDIGIAVRRFVEGLLREVGKSFGKYAFPRTIFCNVSANWNLFSYLDRNQPKQEIIHVC